MAGVGDDSTELDIETRAGERGAPVIVLSGELDISTAGALEAALAGVRADAPELVTVDVGGLRFMDSAGIAVLVGALREVKIELRDPSPIVRQVIEASGLTELLPFVA